jgi:antitoxin component YwqK of YwqJK toxin-antitoxin module
MNKILIILSIVLLAACSPKEFPPSHDLVERDGIFYEGDSETPFTGTRKKYHPEGQLEREGNFTDGKREGLWEFYHENGQLQERGNLKDGRVDGLWETYHDNGQLNQKGNYKDGKQEGLWEYYHDNGQLSQKGNYKDGKREGLFEFYHENGQLQERGNFKDGEGVGTWEFYHDNGQLSQKGNFKDGKQEGLWEFYHDNGQLSQKGNYKDGKQEGLWETYHDNGQLSQKGNYKDGKQEGLWEYYHDNGKLSQRGNWKNGKEVKLLALNLDCEEEKDKLNSWVRFDPHFKYLLLKMDTVNLNATTTYSYTMMGNDGRRLGYPIREAIETKEKIQKFESSYKIELENRVQIHAIRINRQVLAESKITFPGTPGERLVCKIIDDATYDEKIKLLKDAVLAKKIEIENKNQF